MKKMQWIFNVLIVLALLLTGCGPIAITPPDRAELPESTKTPTTSPEICLSAFGMDFETLPLGATYTLSDTFDENGVIVTFAPFYEAGVAYNLGEGVIENGGMAGGSGKDLGTNNINARFFFPFPIERLTLRFGDHGGSENIEINGDLVEFGNFNDINGDVIGGVQVSVPSGVLGNGTGVLKLDGVIESFAIGGQELWIDDLCPVLPECDPECPEICLDFESQAVGTRYNVGDSFVENEVSVAFEPFFPETGNPGFSGVALIENEDWFGVPGNGLRLRGIKARFVFLCPVETLFVTFMAGAGSYNIEINGELRIFDEFGAIDGEVIGGVVVSLAGGDYSQGILALEGKINSFSIGGGYLGIGDVCQYYIWK